MFVLVELREGNNCGNLSEVFVRRAAALKTLCFMENRATRNVKVARQMSALPSRSASIRLGSRLSRHSPNSGVFAAKDRVSDRLGQG
jgi:hypothetical protein